MSINALHDDFIFINTEIDLFNKVLERKKKMGDESGYVTVEEL